MMANKKLPFGDAKAADVPDELRSMAADWRRGAEWEKEQSRADDVHPNDAAEHENEWARLLVIAAQIEMAADEIERRIA